MMWRVLARRSTIGRIVAASLLSAAVNSTAGAQNWSFDARRIALGGIGDTANIASQLVKKERGYGTIVLPFGLLQVFEDTSIFDPGDDNFDPVRAAEYLASPLHYTLDRNTSSSGQQFAEGLASPSWGKTFTVQGERGGAFHGVYVGAGPYLSIRTDNVIDQGFIDLLASDVDVFEPNASFLIADDTLDQFALAITGGYRARIPFPGRSNVGSGRNGVYIAVNYNYLYGFRYDDLS